MDSLILVQLSSAASCSWYHLFNLWLLFRPSRHAILSLTMHQQSVMLHICRHNHTIVKSCGLNRYWRWWTNRFFSMLHTLHAQFSGKVDRYIHPRHFVCTMPWKQSSHAHTVKWWEMSWLLPKVPSFRYKRFCIPAFDIKGSFSLSIWIRHANVQGKNKCTHLSLIHIWRCRRSTLCRSRWSPYH